MVPHRSNGWSLQRTYLRAFASFLLATVVIVWLGSAVSAELDTVPPFAGTTLDQNDILKTIATSQSRQFKPVGHTSVAYRMRTRARVTAALKVRSREIQRGYQYEIAAYRLGRLLGLDNVPPAIYRRATRREIESRFHEEKRHRWGSVRRATLWDDDGSVPGAAIYWIKGARSDGLARYEGDWKGWLRIGGSIPEGKTALARDLSAMRVFDFLIGNWDRHSGGNLPSDPDRNRVYLRDNDRAFSTPLLERRYDELLRALTTTERFSKDMIGRLAALDEEAIRASLARDPSNEVDPLLTEMQIAQVMDRRATILSYVAARVQEHGQDDVLFFP